MRPTLRVHTFLPHGSSCAQAPAVPPTLSEPCLHPYHRGRNRGAKRDGGFVADGDRQSRYPLPLHEHTAPLCGPAARDRRVRCVTTRLVPPRRPNTRSPACTALSVPTRGFEAVLRRAGPPPPLSRTRCPHTDAGFPRSGIGGCHGPQEGQTKLAALGVETCAPGWAGDPQPGVPAAVSDCVAHLVCRARYASGPATPSSSALTPPVRVLAAAWTRYRRWRGTWQ